MTYTEKDYEKHIETKLKDIQYISLNNTTYDKVLCLAPKDVLNFIKNSQPKSFEKLSDQYGSDTEEKLLNRLSNEINSRGVIDVLRKGIKDRGASFDLVYFEPNSGLNPETKELYQQNIFTVIRQVKYSTQNEKSIDMVLFVNGIPIVTIELKNSLTGQKTIHAIRQYINDRDPREPLFKFKRCLVHFAVGNEEVFMTTKLSGKNTRFLPFNKAIVNPVNKEGHKVSYLWEELFQKSSLLDLIQNYVHIRKEKDHETNIEKENLIFPRYHQLVSINKLKKTIKKESIGKRYLIQHTTGSGKSLTIGWLAYQLITLFKTKESTERIFDTVVILTDRKVLDKQLRNTVIQLEQTTGVVNPVTEDSNQLKKFLEAGKSIIISTIQKFPFISSQISQLKSRSFAVIIDEVHSSQSGRLSAHLVKSLSDKELDEYQEGEEEEDLTGLEEYILNQMAQLKDTKHISYFGFSGTPKKKTLEMFGTKNELGKFQAFHLYSMQQSIAESFTLDVLRNYITYPRYFKLNEKIENDKTLPRTKARSLLVKVVDLLPHTIKEKTKIMLDHFMRQTSNKIEGKGKAMVVTRSRLHCVKYKLEFDKQLKELGLPYGCLVAFSGTVKEKGFETEYTEASMNNFSDKFTEENFKKPEYKILIVNNKFQTGFDEPMLHTMYVDKKMLGLQCVQTLSRLNRTMKGKTDTVVLDFVNKAEIVRESFQPYYKGLILSEETDPNQLYKIETNIKKFNLFDDNTVNEFAKIYYNKQIAQEKLQGVLDTVADRFGSLQIKEKKEFRSNILLFIRTYGFLCQIITFEDVNLEKLFIFLMNLNKKLPYIDTEQVDISTYVDLEFFKIQKEFEGSLSLEDKDEVVDPITTTDSNVVEEEHDTISNIIKEVNERFGADFSEEDRNNFEKMKQKIWEDEEWNDVKSSEATETNKRLIFKKVFEKALLGLVDDNLSFYEKLSKDDRKKYIQDHLYRELNR